MSQTVSQLCLDFAKKNSFFFNKGQIHSEKPFFYRLRQTVNENIVKLNVSDKKQVNYILAVKCFKSYTIDEELVFKLAKINLSSISNLVLSDSYLNFSVPIELKTTNKSTLYIKNAKTKLNTMKSAKICTQDNSSIVFDDMLIRSVIISALDKSNIKGFTVISSLNYVDRSKHSNVNIKTKESTKIIGISAAASQKRKTVKKNITQQKPTVQKRKRTQTTTAAAKKRNTTTKKKKPNQNIVEIDDKMDKDEEETFEQLKQMYERGEISLDKLYEIQNVDTDDSLYILQRNNNPLPPPREPARSAVLNNFITNTISNMRNSQDLRTAFPNPFFHIETNYGESNYAPDNYIPPESMNVNYSLNPGVKCKTNKNKLLNKTDEENEDLMYNVILEKIEKNKKLTAFEQNLYDEHQKIPDITCLVCKERKSRTFINECGHLRTCFSCTNQLIRRKFLKCSECNTAGRYVKLYY